MVTNFIVRLFLREKLLLDTRSGLALLFPSLVLTLSLLVQPATRSMEMVQDGGMDWEQTAERPSQSSSTPTAWLEPPPSLDWTFSTVQFKPSQSTEPRDSLSLMLQLTAPMEILTNLDTSKAFSNTFLKTAILTYFQHWCLWRRIFYIGHHLRSKC